MTNKKLIKSAFIDDADVMKAIENREHSDLLSKVLSGNSDEFLKALRGLLKGDDGYTPVKGKDYFTSTEIDDMKAEILKGATPEKFKDYFTEKELVYIMTELRKVFENDFKTMKSQITPIKGVDYRDGKDADEEVIVGKVLKRLPAAKEFDPKAIMEELKSMTDKFDKVPTAQEIVKEIKSKKLINKSDIRVDMNDMRWHGGGLSTVSHDSTLTGNGTPSSPLSVVGGGSGYTILVVAGVIDDINMAFTVVSLPKEVVINGMSYIPTGGAITWSYLAGALTLSSPVGQGGSIYARS